MDLVYLGVRQFVRQFVNWASRVRDLWSVPSAWTLLSSVYMLFDSGNDVSQEAPVHSLNPGYFLSVCRKCRV